MYIVSKAITIMMKKYKVRRGNVPSSKELDYLFNDFLRIQVILKECQR